MLPETRHNFEVIRLWEQPLDVFLSTPGLLPFAVLSQAVDRQAILQRVATQLDAIPDRRTRSNVSAAAAILAGLVLEQGLIQQILRSEIMQESVIYQDILRKGEQRGRQEGRQEEGRSLVLRLLTRKFGELPHALRSRVEQLSLVQLEALGEALLDFSAVQDLTDWLENRV